MIPDANLSALELKMKTSVAIVVLMIVSGLLAVVVRSQMHRVWIRCV
jgi:hypothetical protein